MSKVKIGEINIDSGTVMVGDPCYFIGDRAPIKEKCKTWCQACDDIFCAEGNFSKDKGLDVYNLGVAVNTSHGDGDGVYPVYLKTTKSGKRRLVVKLD